MRQLHFDLLRLLADDRQGSHGSRPRPALRPRAGGGDAAPARLPGSAGEGAEGPARRSAGGGVAPAGSLRRYSQESHGAPSLAGEQDRQAGDRAPGQRELWGRRAVRGLNRDLLQLRRRAGGDSSHATRRDRPHQSARPGSAATRAASGGDDHVTRASDAIERESGERHGGKSRERSAGRERAGQESGRPEREVDRRPCGAGGPGCESRARAGRRADAEDARRRSRSVAPPFPLPAKTPAAPCEHCRKPRCARPAEPGVLAAIDPAAAGETMIGQARRSRDCAGDGPGRKLSPEIIGVGMWDQSEPKGKKYL